MWNCEPAFYLCFGDLPFDLVWSNCECVIRPEVTWCGVTVSVSFVLMRPGWDNCECVIRPEVTWCGVTVSVSFVLW